MATSGPTVRKRQLGAELRRLRVSAGRLIEDAAAHLECSQAKISRVETGQAPITSRDVKDLLAWYGVTEEAQVAAVLQIHRDAQQRGWWEAYDDVLPSGMSTYAGLESDAVTLDVYEPLLVNGLFQTEDYARAMIRSDREPDEVERLVRFRMERRAALTRSQDPMAVWAIHEESTLRRPLGGVDVMRAQLRLLAELSTLPNVTIQILAHAKGAHVGLNGGFTLLGFDQLTPPGVYLETAGGNIYLQRPADVRKFQVARDQLVGAANDPDDTITMLERIDKEMK